MEVPFYTTFSEFKHNYDTDFEQWKQTFPDGSEYDFVNEIRSVYGAFLNNDGSDIFEDISTNWVQEDYPEYCQLSLTQYADLMQDKLTQYAQDHELLSFESDYSFSLKDEFEILDYWTICNFRFKNSDVLIDDERHKYFKEFFISFGIH